MALNHEQFVRWMSADIYDKISSDTSLNFWICCNDIYPRIPSVRPDNLLEFIVNLGTHMYYNEYINQFVNWCEFIDIKDSYEMHAVITSPYNYSDDVDSTVHDIIWYDPRIYDILFSALQSYGDAMYARMYRAKLITAAVAINHADMTADKLYIMMTRDIVVSGSRFVRALCDIAVELNVRELIDLMFNSVHTPAFVSLMTPDHRLRAISNRVK